MLNFIKYFLISFFVLSFFGLIIFWKDINFWIITIIAFIYWIVVVSNEKPQNNPDYFPRNEWRELRRKALERDKYRCSECKKTFYNNKSKLHVHHIIERFQWGEDNLDNLTCLCESCHWKIHQNGEKPMHANTKKKIIESTIANSGVLHFDYRAESLGGIGTNSTRKVKPEKFYSQNGHYYMYWFCYLDNDFRYFRVSRIVRFHQE